jgi:hypothetical protein
MLLTPFRNFLKLLPYIPKLTNVLFDLSIIDKPAQNTNESAIAFREVVSHRRVFIPREDVPDKGCDLDVELINDVGKRNVAIDSQ